MRLFDWILLGGLALEFLLRVILEIREARLSTQKFDRFTFFRIIPIVNDIFPHESNFDRKEDEGAFVIAHEKAHQELHHGFILRSYQVVKVLIYMVILVLATVYFGIIDMILSIHLAQVVFTFLHHKICFVEEYEADELAAKRVSLKVAKRALESLSTREFPRSPLFAFIYRVHPTAQMRLNRILRTCKRSQR